MDFLWWKKQPNKMYKETESAFYYDIPAFKLF